MVWDIVIGLAGAIVAWAALHDVFDTVAVPGGSRAWLKVVRRLVWGSLPLIRRLRPQRGLPTWFAPLVLVLAFVVWMVLIAVGFGLMTYALRGDFHPPLRNVPDAIYYVGTAMTTIGRGGTQVVGVARWVVLAAGFCGLAGMTLAITYLLEVQSGIGQRDSGIIKLTTSAGEPPSALRMLEKFAGTGNRRHIADVMRDGRTWCATVRQSHTNRPSLIYFASVATDSGWPAALGALIDLSLLYQLVLDDDALRGPAILLGEDATRLATDLAALVGLVPQADASSPAEAAVMIERLRAAGYSPRAGADPEYFCIGRAAAHGCVTAMARHLGKPTAQLAPR